MKSVVFAFASVFAMGLVVLGLESARPGSYRGHAVRPYCPPRARGTGPRTRDRAPSGADDAALGHV